MGKKKKQKNEEKSSWTIKVNETSKENDQTFHGKKGNRKFSQRKSLTQQNP